MTRSVAGTEGASRRQGTSICAAHRHFVAALWQNCCGGRRVLPCHRLANSESKP